MSERVIVGYDGSDHASAAVDWAAQEASSRGASLTLLSAMTVPVAGVGMTFGVALAPDAIDDLLERMRAQAEARAAKVRAAYPAMQVESHVVLGSPAFALVEASADASLVVVGSRGLGGFRGLLLGSVGTQVATHASCPVAVIRRTPPPASSVVVVGVDGSPMSIAALDFACDLAERHGWSVRAVHAWQLPTFDVLSAPAGPPPIDVDSIEEGERMALAESIAGLREAHPGLRLEERVSQEPPVRALLDASDDAALIVVGTRGRGEFLGAVLGSVSQGVLQRATVPVAVVAASPKHGQR